MKQRITGALLVFMGSLFSWADVEEKPGMPSDVPPLLGMAKVDDSEGGKAGGEWMVRVMIPRASWSIEGEIIPKRQWPELNAQVKAERLTLRMGGPSALSPSQIVDRDGKELSSAEIRERLREEVPVLVSVSGKFPDRYYLQLIKPEALIVLIGPRDGAPAPHLLPAEMKE